MYDCLFVDEAQDLTPGRLPSLFIEHILDLNANYSGYRYYQ